MIEALIDAGLKRIEATSFVSAKWVPQMSDADQVCRMVEKPADVTFSALVPNARGLERAGRGIDEAAVFLSASETHNRKNVNKSVAETPARLRGGQRACLAQRDGGAGYVSTVWGCPYEGPVDPRRPCIA
ncbi:MAG: hypothetical protein IPG17_21055 [Sandaracinaceae bacterium]|nr:hypothetical protein [Sandaracinaceae bacterium]